MICLSAICPRSRTCAWMAPLPTPGIPHTATHCNTPEVKSAGSTTRVVCHVWHMLCVSCGSQRLVSRVCFARYPMCGVCVVCRVWHISCVSCVACGSQRPGSREMLSTVSHVWCVCGVSCVAYIVCVMCGMWLSTPGIP